MTGKDIHLAAELLRSGKLVAIPTETVYGLAANALNAEAVIGIFEAKNRPRFNPLIIHIGKLSQLYNYVIDPRDELLQLAGKFWPGPLTILFNKNALIHDLVTAGSPLVAVRIPDHSLTKSLLGIIDFPLAAPSANPFGYISPTTAEHVEKQLGDRVDYILDGGPCTIGLESTIIKLNTRDQIEILRQGAVTLQDLQNTSKLEVIVKSDTNIIEAPGMLKMHYAPGKPMQIGDIDVLVSSLQSKKLGILSFNKTYNNENILQQEVLSTSGNLHQAAYNLFAALHRLDEGSCEIIIAELLPEIGIGCAINDKLRRASAI